MIECPGPSKFIEDIYLLKGLTESQREVMLRSAHCHKLDAGERIFNHGDPATHFYWLCSGQVKLTRLSADGEEKCIEIVQPGKTFAEGVMFMENSCYPVNAETVKKSTLVAFSNKDFRELLKDSSDTCFRLLSDLSRHLHAHINEIDRLTLSNAMTRVATYLLELADNKNHIDLGISKHLLASRLSIQPETLSRLLSRLQKEQLITVDGQKIDIHDRDALREFVRLPEV